MNFYVAEIEKEILFAAFSATCRKRGTIFTRYEIETSLRQISDDLHMAELWEEFKMNNFYVGDLEWKVVIVYIEEMMKRYLQ